MNDIFKATIDELVLLAENDPELKEGLKYVDKNVNGETFYDKVFNVLHRHDINKRAKEWLKDRN